MIFISWPANHRSRTGKGTVSFTGESEGHTFHSWVIVSSGLPDSGIKIINQTFHSLWNFVAGTAGGGRREHCSTVFVKTNQFKVNCTVD